MFRGIHRSVLLLHLGEASFLYVVQVLGFPFARRPEHPVCVKNRFLPVCSVPLPLAWRIKRTLSLLGSHLIPASLHPSFTSIGSLPSTFFIEYSTPTPLPLPIPYNLSHIMQLGCKCLCMSFCLGVADIDDGSGNNKTCTTSRVDGGVVFRNAGERATF